VHDELVIEVLSGQAEALVLPIKTAMESAMSLSVPLTVEVGIGQHWGTAH
jgi:DNA polymerase-1